MTNYTHIIKISLVLVLTLLKVKSHGQNDFHVNRMWDNRKCENNQGIDKFEIEIDSVERDLILNRFFRIEYNAEQDLGFAGDTSEVYIVNLNNDSFPDIIHTNGLGMPSVEFYFGQKNGFTPVLNGPLGTFLKDIRVNNGKIEEVILTEPSYVLQRHCEHLYRFDGKKFDQIHTRCISECTIKPDSFYNVPRKVKYKNHKTQVLENPKHEGMQCYVLYDQDPKDGLPNVIIDLMDNFSVYCWGEYRDQTKNLWYLMEIPIRFNTEKETTVIEFH
ncbi:MAG TPA: hypothetical protein PJ990_04495, partial [Saprospiraceae bacterium]|nr:hypothetical protein [Saprospiraceae bacterium]